MAEGNSTQARAATYYRKSTDEQEHSIDRQRGQVNPYCASRGYRVVREEVDEGIAGDEFDRRPGLQKLLAAAARREFDVIVVDEPSRLSRQSPIDVIEKIIAPLRRSGVRIDTVSKGPQDYDSLAGLIMMTVHAHKSEDEAADLSRRVLGGMARRAREGLWFGWMAPYGLRKVRHLDPASGKVLSRECVLGPEEEVRAVRYIFDAVANRGLPLRRVCRELEARGVKPPAGNGRGANKREGRWNPATVRKILLNRKYVGDLPWNETHVGKYTAWKGGNQGAPAPSGRRGRRTSKNALEDVIVVPDVIPPLVDRDTFARAALALARQQKRTNPTGDPNHYLFTHMLVCGDCRSFMRGMPRRGRKTYICARYKEYGSKACSRNSVDEDAVRKAVLAALLDDILDPKRLDAVEAEVARRLRAERASGEADRLQKQLDALARDIAQGNANLARLPPDRLPGVTAQVRAWEDEHKGLAARLQELRDGADQSTATLAEARRQLWRLREALEGDDLEAQAAVVREVVTKVEVRFDHVKTHGRKSPTGQGRNLNLPAGALVYVRPGLGLSCLCIPDCRNRAPGGGPGRASSCPRGCRGPG
jgi:site-specific DNA recombinase